MAIYFGDRMLLEAGERPWNAITASQLRLEPNKYPWGLALGERPVDFYEPFSGSDLTARYSWAVDPASTPPSEFSVNMTGDYLSLEHPNTFGNWLKASLELREIKYKITPQTVVKCTFCPVDRNTLPLPLRHPWCTARPCMVMLHLRDANGNPVSQGKNFYLEANYDTPTQDNLLPDWEGNLTKYRVSVNAPQGEWITVSANIKERVPEAEYIAVVRVGGIGEYFKGYFKDLTITNIFMDTTACISDDLSG